MSRPISTSVSANGSFACPPNLRVKAATVPPESLPFKVVATDMDGTLLNKNGTVSDVTKEVLSRLLARGVHIIFATARPFTDVQRIKRGLNIFAKTQHIPTPGVEVTTPTVSSPVAMAPEAYAVAAESHEDWVIPRCFAIACNGACVYNEANERVFERFIHPQAAAALYELRKDDEEVNCSVFRTVDASDREAAGYYNPSDKADDKAFEEWVCRRPAPEEAALYMNNQFCYREEPELEKKVSTDKVSEVFFLCYNRDKCPALEEEINAKMVELQEALGLPHPPARVAPSADYCLDVMPYDISKATALQYVVEQLGYTMADCIAFGDGMNDREMLNNAGKGCVMGNASERLKKALPDLEVIRTNGEDGVAQKLKEVFSV